jgi:molybdenum cofactor biosynthesis enzyme MoaA
LLVRFIELMPVSSTGVLGEENFFSVQDAMQLLSKHDTLKAIPEYRPGNGPARYYEMARSGARIGFIGALTTPDFCGTCNKLRLTADGKLRPCLGATGNWTCSRRFATTETCRQPFWKPSATSPRTTSLRNATNRAAQ